jgi:hypothetical protein
VQPTQAPVPAPISVGASSTPRPLGTVPPTPDPGKSGVDGDLVGDAACPQPTTPCGQMSPLLSGTVWAQQNGATVASTHTNKDNNQFRLTLPTGDYTIYAKADDDRHYPSCTPVNVTVPQGQYASVRIDCRSK